MSTIRDVLGGIAVEVAKEAVAWAVNKAKARAKEKLGQVVADSLDPAVIEALLTAELLVLAKAMEGVVKAFDAPAKPLGLDEPLTEGMTVEVVAPTGDEPTFKPNQGK